MNLKKIIILSGTLFLVLGFLFGGYSYWNSVHPQKSCASCHEISPSVVKWEHSAHRNVRCTECHGTALSNGVHSLTEKANMVFTHFGEKKFPEEIRLSEKQVQSIAVKCAECHQSEYAKWRSGGHSADYARIFLDEEHNKTEKPYWDCFRCHGMFYEGNNKSLLKEPQAADGVWVLNDPAKAAEPTIPCLACHQMHSENEPLAAFDPNDSLKIQQRNPSVSWYIRTDKRHQQADKLMTIAMYDSTSVVKVAGDPVNKLCIQCHSPNFARQVGSQDDRTPVGVHEGISCGTCHEPHSNDARNSCQKCHPASSNCGLEVTAMNTTYRDPNSPNNIHRVSCSDCHAEDMRARALNRKLNQAML